MRILHLSWLLATLLAFPFFSNATTYTLNGNDWVSNPSNWATDVFPPNPLPSGDSIIVTGNSQLNINNYVVGNGATITIISGATLSFFSIGSAFQFTNQGTFTIYGALLHGELIVNNGTMINYGVITLIGLESVHPAILTNYGVFTNNGHINRMSSETGILNHHVGALLNGIGTIDYKEGTILSDGALQPGNSTGIFTISSGNIIMNGPFGVEITGPPSGGAGVSFDQLVVAGTATVNGAINVNFGSYSPAGGATYQIILAAAYAGIPVVFVTPNTISATYLNGILTVGAALPVTWLNFRATLNEKNGVDLLWSTASESNNEGFDIERSANGRDWETLAFVPGSGTTSEIQTYQYTDSSPFTLHSSPLYYRLKQTDFSGAFEYSPIRVVEIQNGSDIRVYPNPAGEEVTIYFGEPTEVRGALQVFSREGRLLFEQDIPLHSAYFRIDLSSQQTGIYFLKITTLAREWTQRLVVE